MNGRNALQTQLNDPKYLYKDDYTYNVKISTTLAAAGVDTLTFNIDGDSDFYLTKTSAYAQVGSDGTTYSAQQLPGVTALITDTTSGRALSSSAVPLPNIFGTGQLPFIWPIVRLFAAKSTITIALANITDNSSYTQLHLSFIGIKAFFKG